MKFLHATSMLIGLGIVTAAPTPSNDPINWNNVPDQDTFRCGLHTYTRHEIYLAARHGTNLELIGQTRGLQKYPHRFFNYEGFDFPRGCPADKYLKEYPVVSPGPYDRGPNNDKQGAERLIYRWVEGERSVDGNPIVVFCGLLTHYQAGGGFNRC